MKSKKVDQKNTKKSGKKKDDEEVVDGPEASEKEGEEIEEHPDLAGVPAGLDEGDPILAPDALVEEETAEIPDEVGFDDLTDDEREMLGLEAKPKVVAEEGEEDTGSSWEEFGYDEEELS